MDLGAQTLGNQTEQKKAKTDNEMRATTIYLFPLSSVLWVSDLKDKRAYSAPTVNSFSSSFWLKWNRKHRQLFLCVTTGREEENNSPRDNRE